MSRRLVILDRDGVINHDSDEFIKSPDEWRAIDGSLDAIRRLSEAGFEVAIATNQSGVGRKLLDVPTLEAIHRKMKSAVRDAGGDVGKIVYCPHHPDAGCDCRKPLPGLLKQLSRKYGVPATTLFGALRRLRPAKPSESDGDDAPYGLMKTLSEDIVHAHLGTCLDACHAAVA